MAATKLGLYELLAPQFLAGGIRFSETADRYLSVLDVDELHEASDESGVVYTGRVSFRDEIGAVAVRKIEVFGVVISWEDLSLDFRLTIPRDGAQFIDDAASAIALGAPADPKADDLDVLFTALGPVEQAGGTATEFPGIRFRLELLLTTITLHLSNLWIPGKKGADFRIIPDPERAGQDVRFLLPKMVFEYEQSDALLPDITFRMKSWGSSGFDAPADLAEGEVVTMEPPIALRTDGRYAFSVEHVVVDLSPDHTPPEILEFFGTDEAFEGFLIKGARFFYSDKDKDFAFDFAIRDLLFSFAGEISFEAQLDLLFERALTLGINVTPKFFDHKGEIRDYIRGTPADGLHSNVLTRGAAKVPQTAFLQMEITGGIPDYTISVKLDGVEIFDPARREARISPGMPGTLHPVTQPNQPAIMLISVTDSAKEPNVFSEEIRVIIVEAPRQQPADRRDGAPADRPPDQDDLPLAKFEANATEVANLKPGFSVSYKPDERRGIAETLAIASPLPPVVRVNGTEFPVENGRVRFDVKEGTDTSPLAIEIAFPQIPAPTPVGFSLRFKRNRPKDAEDIRRYVGPNLTPSPFDQAFADSGGREGLRNFITSHQFTSVKVDAFASHQQDTRQAEDKELSERRLKVAKEIIKDLITVPAADAVPHGFENRPSLTDPDQADDDNENDQVAIVQGIFPPTPPQTVHATISRKKRKPPDPPPPGEVIVPADREAPRPQTRRPPVWKRLSFRTRFERNEPVLGEVSGTIDFETKSEEALRRGMRDSGQPVEDTDKLGLKQSPAASADSVAQDGVVDFKLNVAYDTATGQLTETLSFGDTKDEVNGLLRMENPRVGQLATTENRLKDTLGAVLVFTPIINAAAGALDPESAGDWAVLGVSLGVPVAIGALDIFQTKAITLFAGTGVFRQFLPPGEDAIEFTDFGVVFDYRVEFDIHFDIDLINLHIHTTKPLKVRYKAVGFNVHLKDGEPFYQPIFDTSKGYEIDLSDPGLLDLPAPLGSILKIAAARIARFNPLTLELDLALKADLGVITVDRFKVKAPLDPPGLPTILPSGVKVNVPSTIVGSGYVNILDSGFEGALDITLVPTKLRVAASLAVQSIEDATTQRKAIAVFVGIVVEFPTPIVIFSTGLGIYGFSGLFAMHYKRDERPRPAGDSVAPALRWLERAGGEPEQLVRGADHLWVPEFDRWSIGIGAVLGTIEGAFIINLRGMFVLELPGPRVLVFVKVQVLKTRPGLGDPQLTTGILGIIDIAPEAITIGVIIEKKIEKLISIRLPVEIFFGRNTPRNWHLDIGTIVQPAEALVLNAIRAHGYFMFHGDKIEGFPGANGPVTLPGIAVATGIKVSLVLGRESVRLFLRCTAEAHLGIAFSPFFITGIIRLKGELRLFIVSIQATGELTVEAPDPTIISGKVCGKVSFFFFSVKGCVGLTIGSGSHSLPAPPLVRNVYLQSHAPVISAGQGGDRPIDATLGDAVALDPPSGGELPVVPIDSVPVVQMHAAPRVTDGTSTTTTFTEPLVFAPNLAPNGFVDVGGGRQVRYFLKEIALDPPLPAGSGKPPATWRAEQAPQPGDANTNVDLALFSRVPVTAARALERSTDLSTQITDRWSGMCDPVAPPACVLWTFCREPLGPSEDGEGWHLQGIAEPDPPGTHRHGAPPLELYVEEPAREPDDALLDLLLTDAGFAFDIPAKVLGINSNTVVAEQPPPVAKKCVDFRRGVASAGPNPRVAQGVIFLTRNAVGQKTAKTRVVKNGAFVGLHCADSLEITLPVAATKVELLLVHFAVPAVVVALNEDGTRATKVTMTAKKGKAELITLEGTAIRKVIVRAKQNATLLTRFCFEPGGQTPEPQNFDCFRALQLPQRQPRKTQNPIKLPPELEERAKKRANNQFIILHTGLAVQVRLFLAVAKNLVGAALIQQLDVEGAVLNEKTISAFAPTPVSGISTGLPASWTEPTGPWDDEVIPAATFAADARFDQLNRLFIEFKPDERCTKIRIINPRETQNLPVPAMLLIAVEVCSKAEQDRAEEGEQIQTGEIETLSGFLNGGALVPLLEPNRTYTLTLRYDAESKAADGTTSTESNLRQRFRFRTDSAPRARLDPWVLGTAPDHEARFHFYEEPMTLVFNDVATVQLFATYGKNLRAVLRAADGVPVAPDESMTFDPIVGEFSSAYRDLLAALIAAGLAPCVGEVSQVLHFSYTSPVTLRPLMGYTFDIELVPPPAQAPTVPLYRRSFATSKFATLGALIDDLRASNIRHRALTAPLATLPDIATDQQIQDALLAAGEQALPAAATTGITIYWAVRAGSSRFFPQMILLDAAEPLWRTRSEPRLETVPNQSDPAFQRVVPQNVTALEIIEQAGANIAHFVRSPSGTRTLAMVASTFTPPAAGATITLAARRPASALYSLAEQVVQIAAIKFTKAPWEEDDV